jgi:hypothetical protein
MAALDIKKETGHLAVKIENRDGVIHYSRGSA